MNKKENSEFKFWHKNLYQLIKDFIRNMGKSAHPKHKMKEWEKAWLASAIDGEGSIICCPPRVSGISVCVFNTNLDYIKEAARLLGIKARIHSRNYSKNPNAINLCYRAVLCGKVAIEIVLKQILPYLIIKKKKAEKTLEWIKQHQPRARILNIPNYDAWDKGGEK